MKWIEQIVLRSSRESLQDLDLNGLITAVFNNDTNRPQEVKVCRHDNLETDICILIYWSGVDETGTGYSKAAKYLSEYLKDYGLVNLSSWIEILDYYY